MKRTRAKTILGIITALVLYGQQHVQAQSCGMCAASQASGGAVCTTRMGVMAFMAAGAWLCHQYPTTQVVTQLALANETITSVTKFSGINETAEVDLVAALGWVTFTSLGFVSPPIGFSLAAWDFTKYVLPEFWPVRKLHEVEGDVLSATIIPLRWLSNTAYGFWYGSLPSSSQVSSQDPEEVMEAHTH